MQIAIVGCGALGSFYGARLQRAGNEVHFLLRSDYEHVTKKGLKVQSIEGNFHIQPKCHNAPDSIGPVDLVIIGMKTTGNHSFPSLLPPLVDSHTAVLTLQNGMGSTDQLAELFNPEQILCGLCFVCINRLSPGVIDHTAHGRITMGEFDGWPKPRTHDIAQLFKNAGIPCQVLESLEAGQWEKLVWNIPFNGLGVAAAFGLEAMTSPALPEELTQDTVFHTKSLLESVEWRQLVHDLMLEVMATSEAYGHTLPSDLADKMILRTGEMGAYKASTVLDFEKGIPMEIDTLFLEPHRRAKAKNVPTPILDRLCQLMQSLKKP